MFLYALRFLGILFDIIWLNNSKYPLAIPQQLFKYSFYRQSIPGNEAFFGAVTYGTISANRNFSS